MKHKKLLIVIAVILLLAGLGFLLFPPISNGIGKMQNDKLSRQFDNKREHIVEQLEDDEGHQADNSDDAQRLELTDSEGYQIDTSGKRLYDFPFVFRKDLDRLRKDSEAYNKGLIGHQSSAKNLHYEYSVFDLRDYGVYDGMYACLTIPKIDLRLPVYLGADNSIMQYGIGHLYGTSLPLDEKDTNCALAGHTDYIGRIFFDNIRNLSEGDEVIVRNYWEDIVYHVVDRKVVKEDQANDLLIQKDRQLLTLITCIKNDDGGFDRFLVICEK